MYRIDLHVHTENSHDGSIRTRDIPKLMSRRGINKIAVTDHDTFTKVNNTIPGMEIKTDMGDVIVLFIVGEIKEKTVGGVLDAARDMNAFTLLPHPWRNKHFVSMSDNERKRFASGFDAVEVLNGRTKPEDNHKAQEFAKKCGFQIAAGSDAHTPFEMGICGIELHEIPSSDDDIKEALFSGRYNLFGREVTWAKRMFSKASGKYRKEGLSGVIRSVFRRPFKHIINSK